MALINFKDINCKKSIDKTNKVINFNGSEIEIVNYLSANDKYDLIMITLQKSFERNIYNAFKMDMYFALNVVYSYTNIVFDDEDRLDEAKLFDTMTRSGLIDAVLNEIDVEELDYLKSCVLRLSDVIIKYRNTFGSVFEMFIEQLPDNMNKVKTMLGEMDPDKVKALVEMVKTTDPSVSSNA